MTAASGKAAPEVLTPQQVAALLAVDVKTVTRWAQAGRLRSFRTPGGPVTGLRRLAAAVTAWLTYDTAPGTRPHCDWCAR